MNSARLIKHLDRCHDIYLKNNCTLKDWLEAEEEWLEDLKYNPGRPHPANIPSSDKEGAPPSNEDCIGEQYSSSDEKIKEEVNIDLPVTRKSQSGSSSDDYLQQV